MMCFGRPSLAKATPLDPQHRMLHPVLWIQGCGFSETKRGPSLGVIIIEVIIDVL